MNRSSILALGFLLSLTPCFGQTTPSESQTLQALLFEVRQLRQDLQTMTIAVQRAQILLYRSQGQEAAVARASQRLDGARERLAAIQDQRGAPTQREPWAADIKRQEDFLSNTENPPAQRKEIEDGLPPQKTRLESLKNEEQQRQTQEIEAEQQLRAEEVRLSDLRDQLDRLDKALESAAHKPDGSAQ